MSGAIKREQGESFSSFSARQRAAQDTERLARPVRAKHARQRKPTWSEREDDTPFGQGDNLGESPDW